jgi:hypothetical protein
MTDVAVQTASLIGLAVLGCVVVVLVMLAGWIVFDVFYGE